MKNSQYNKNKGARAERDFKQKYKGNIIRKATKEEDIHEHWDFLLKTDAGKEYTVDVKSKNKYPDSIRVETKRRWEALKWCHPKGVPEHLKKGWLFGDSDFIAYQLDNGFEWFKTSELVEIYTSNKDSLDHLDYQEGSQIAFIPRSLLHETK